MSYQSQVKEGIVLSLAAIRTDGGTQPRAQIDMVVVADYAADMGNGATFPPVVVFYDGADYWLADGFHRVEAAKTLGLAEINADVRQGTQQDAQWHSYSTNQSHGLRRTNGDKRRALSAALEHPYSKGKSTYDIARHCGVSAEMVRTSPIYQSLVDTSERTVTRNGSAYTMNVAAIGQRVAPAPVERVPFLDDWGVVANEAIGDEDEEWTPQEEYEYDLRETKAAQAAGFNVPLPEPPAPKPHVAHNAGNNEWYTPPEYINAAVKVMGGIDLDPATSQAANEVVGAATIYTAEDNGLVRHWRGRVWMNPPYAGELIGKFTEKLILYVRSGDVPAAIVLVNNATETGWFSALMGVASAVVFPRGRVRFWEPNGAISAPLQGQALIYIGNSPELFLDTYKGFGWGAKLWR